jgi:predicted DNA-binding protein with PD1-like motif
MGGRADGSREYRLPPTAGATALPEPWVRGPMQQVQEGHRWMLRLDDGQDLPAAVAEFARAHAIRAGVVVSGIGMLRAGAVGFWDGQQYQPRELSEPHELVSLHGSIAEVDGAPSVHLHVGLADRRHALSGGHLLRGTVGVLAEIYVETFPGRAFGRPLNESLGLRALDLEPGPVP